MREPLLPVSLSWRVVMTINRMEVIEQWRCQKGPR